MKTVYLPNEQIIPWFLVSSLLLDTQDNQLIKRRSSFWLTVLEVSFHDQLAPLFWACGRAAHHGRSMWQKQNCLARGQELKVRKRQGPTILFKGMPSMTQ